VQQLVADARYFMRYGWDNMSVFLYGRWCCQPREWKAKYPLSRVFTIWRCMIITAKPVLYNIFTSRQTKWTCVMCGQHVKCAIAIRSAGWQTLAVDIKAAHCAIFTYLFHGAESFLRI